MSDASPDATYAPGIGAVLLDSERGCDVTVQDRGRAADVPSRRGKHVLIARGCDDWLVESRELHALGS
jgi:hypothetical protein